MVTLLSTVGRYDYGFEKSYTRRGLRQMLTRSGFAVVSETAILFIPGWVRMLDLACHAWMPSMAPLTSALVWPFAWLDARWPFVRRHGYLLAAIGEKPAATHRAQSRG
jgi:hypothetical protein